MQRPLLLVLMMVSSLFAADYESGWPVVSSQGAASRVVGDVGWGEELEVVLAYDFVEVFSHSGQLLCSWEVPGPYSAQDVCLGEVWPDLPGLEIILRSPAWFYVLHAPSGTSSLALEQDLPQGINWTPSQCLADVDGDGDDELVLAFPGAIVNGFAKGLIVHPLSGGGSTVETITFAPQPTAEWNLSRLYSADVDFDGAAEIGTRDAGASVPRIFHLVDGSGALVPGFPVASTAVSEDFGLISFGDIDRSGGSEVIGSQTQALVSVENDGSMFFPNEFVEFCAYQPPVIANFDLDPELEIALGSNFDVMRVFDPGAGLQSWTYSGNYYYFLWPTAGDLNGDGVDEIVVRSLLTGSPDQYFVHAFDLVSGSEVPGFPHPIPPSILWLPWRAHVDLYDLDRDGELEVIFEDVNVNTGYTIHVLDVDNPGTAVFEASWPTMDGNAARNGDYHYRRGPYPEIIRGDANDDGEVTLADAITVLMGLFVGGEVDCDEAHDVNASGSLDLADAIHLLGYLFIQGPPPEAPFPQCAPIDRSPTCPVARQCQ